MPERKRTFALLVNPFILAAIPTIVLVFSVPVIKQPYLLDLTGRARVPENTYWSYNDLDGDGNSEKISSFDYPNGSGITIHRDGLTLNQWNIDGTFRFSGKSPLNIPADCNGDGLKELYFFSLRGDSILLHSVPDPARPAMGISNRLIDTAGPGRTGPDPRIVNARPQDLDGDGTAELLFGITSGFSKYPRKIYAYYPAKDSLVSSPPIGGFILDIVQEDIDGDGLSEILPSVYASANIPVSEMKYHDHSAWFTVLDKNLQFMSEPIEVRGNLASVVPMVSTSTELIVKDILVYVAEKDSLTSLVSFTPDGKMSKRAILKVKPYTGFITRNRKKEPVYAVAETDRGVVLYSREKEYVREISMQGSPGFMQEDIDGDGQPEIIVTSQESGRVWVYRAGFRQPVVAWLGPEFNGELLLSVIRARDETPRIYLQTGTSQFWLEYRRNPVYWLSFGLFPLIYAAFIAFVILIQSTTKRVFVKREEERKKLSELQLALIRNQLDPHFTLNALNSVLYLVEQSDREKARESLQRFSGLYRELLLSAGKSRRSLAEEIEFCREYLELEKIRYMNRFIFEFYIQPGINEELPVPKLVLQLFAENSVKHGLAGLDSGGLLGISVTGSGNELMISIKDNGVGRAHAAGDRNGSTGKGTTLMNELFDLCNRLFEDTYSFSITDLTDTGGMPAGTLVTVKIRYRYETLFIS